MLDLWVMLAGAPVVHRLARHAAEAFDIGALEVRSLHQSSHAAVLHAVYLIRYTGMMSRGFYCEREIVLTGVEKPSVTQAFRAAILAVEDGKISAKARAADMNGTKFHEWRNGKGLNVRIETLARVALALGQSPNDLLGWDRFATTQQVGASASAQAAAAQVQEGAAQIGRAPSSQRPLAASRPRKSRK